MKNVAGILLLPLFALPAGPALLPAGEPVPACTLSAAEATILPVAPTAPESPGTPSPSTNSAACGFCGVACRGLLEGAPCTTSAGTWGQCIALGPQCADDTVLCTCG